MIIERATCKDFMLDAETTGLNPGIHAITSFCFVPFVFNMQGEMDFGLPFTIRMSIPTTRRIDADTTEFREKSGVDAAESVLERLTPRIALDAIGSWLGECGINPTIWAKPTKFDIAFFESYFTEYRIDIPWHHRDTVDLRSWCRGLLSQYSVAAGAEAWGEINHEAEQAMHKQNPITDPALNMPHAAIYDCYLQCFILKAAITRMNALERRS